MDLSRRSATVTAAAEPSEFIEAISRALAANSPAAAEARREAGRKADWSARLRPVADQLDEAAARSATEGVKKGSRFLAEASESRRQAMSLRDRDSHQSPTEWEAILASEERSSDHTPHRPRSLKEVGRSLSKGVFALADLLHGQWPGPRILIYHQVGTETGRQMEVTSAAFRAQLDWMLANGKIVSLEDALRRRGSLEANRLFVLTFDDGYEDVFENAYPLLEREGIPFTLYLSTQHIESGVPLGPGRPPLSWEQVTKMTESGLVTLGGHTHRHTYLGRARLDLVEEELAASDELIEDRTGITPRHFAYPWGHWSPIADTVVRRRYESAVLGAGAPVTASTDRFLVHRLPIQHGDGFFYFKRKVLRGMSLEESVRRVVRGYHGP